ncbi:hypothetical protein RAN3_1068 [plant metagenome]|uniref:Uncharacterized protein n=1 Tax=plant metagenome TaxID=1297885 RepID=A0A484V441_9ZZZZ
MRTQERKKARFQAQSRCYAGLPITSDHRCPHDEGGNLIGVTRLAQPALLLEIACKAELDIPKH